MSRRRGRRSILDAEMVRESIRLAQARLNILNQQRAAVETMKHALEAWLRLQAARRDDRLGTLEPPY
jgi:hypothetical protein